MTRELQSLYYIEGQTDGSGIVEKKCHKSEAVGFMSMAPSRIDSAVIVKGEYTILCILR